MIKITSRKLEDIIFKNFNRKVSYLGFLIDNNTYRKIIPTKFVFVEWDKNDNAKKIIIIQQQDILTLIKK